VQVELEKERMQHEKVWVELEKERVQHENERAQHQKAQVELEKVKSVLNKINLVGLLELKDSQAFNFKK
jgi:hypothetical protein